MIFPSLALPLPYHPIRRNPKVDRISSICSLHRPESVSRSGRVFRLAFSDLPSGSSLFFFISTVPDVVGAVNGKSEPTSVASPVVPTKENGTKEAGELAFPSRPPLPPLLSLTSSSCNYPSSGYTVPSTTATTAAPTPAPAAAAASTSKPAAAPAPKKKSGGIFSMCCGGDGSDLKA